MLELIADINVSATNSLFCLEGKYATSAFTFLIFLLASCRVATRIALCSIYS